MEERLKKEGAKALSENTDEDDEWSIATITGSPTHLINAHAAICCDIPISESPIINPRSPDMPPCWYWTTKSICEAGSRCYYDHDPDRKGSTPPAPTTEQPRAKKEQPDEENNPNRRWDRDLVEEGIESNPGPMKSDMATDQHRNTRAQTDTRTTLEQSKNYQKETGRNDQPEICHEKTVNDVGDMEASSNAETTVEQVGAILGKLVTQLSESDSHSYAEYDGRTDPRGTEPHDEEQQRNSPDGGSEVETERLTKELRETAIIDCEGWVIDSGANIPIIGQGDTDLIVKKTGNQRLITVACRTLICEEAIIKTPIGHAMGAVRPGDGDRIFPMGLIIAKKDGKVTWTNKGFTASWMEDGIAREMTCKNPAPRIHQRIALCVRDRTDLESTEPGSTERQADNTRRLDDLDAESDWDPETDLKCRRRRRRKIKEYTDRQFTNREAIDLYFKREQDMRRHRASKWIETKLTEGKTCQQVANEYKNDIINLDEEGDWKSCDSKEYDLDKRSYTSRVARRSTINRDIDIYKAIPADSSKIEAKRTWEVRREEAEKMFHESTGKYRTFIRIKQWRDVGPRRDWKENSEFYESICLNRHETKEELEIRRQRAEVEWRLHDEDPERYEAAFGDRYENGQKAFQFTKEERDRCMKRYQDSCRNEPYNPNEATVDVEGSVEEQELNELMRRSVNRG